MSMRTTVIGFAAPLVLCTTAIAQPAQIGPGNAIASGSGSFYGPSIGPNPVNVANFAIGSIAPDGFWASTDGFYYAWNDAEYSLYATVYYTTFTTPTLTMITGFVRLSSMLANSTPIPATIAGSMTFSVPIELLTNATVTSTFWTPGDPPLATGGYTGFGFANFALPGPAANVPGFGISGSYAPGNYSIGRFINTTMTGANGEFETQNVELNFQVAIEAVPTPGAAALIGLGIGGLASKRRRR